MFFVTNAVRSLFPSIKKEEVKKFLYSSALFFLVPSVYAIARSAKDGLIIGLGGSGTVAVAKLFVLFFMLIFKIAYDWICVRFDRNARFNIVVIYFICFFFLFAIMFKNEEYFIIHFLQQESWQNGKYSALWKILSHWPSTLFYIHAEAWGTYIFSVSLWGFINSITPITQAKSFYPLLITSAAISTLLSGISIVYGGTRLTKKNILPFFSIIIGMCLLILLVYNRFIADMEKNPDDYQLADGSSVRKKKVKLKMNFIDGLKNMIQNIAAICISISVFSYNICINIFEAVQKDVVNSAASSHATSVMLHTTANYKELHRESIQFFTGMQMVFIGIFSLFYIFFISADFKKKGWLFFARLTPSILALGTVIFFGLLNFKNSIGMLPVDFSILKMAAYTGIFTNSAVKGSKYASFDPSKEISYNVIDKNRRLYVKSFVDGLLSRVAKAFGSVIIFFIISPYFGKATNAKMLIFIIILLTISCWFMAIEYLNKLVIRKEKEKEKEKEQKQISSSSEDSCRGSTEAANRGRL